MTYELRAQSVKHKDLGSMLFALCSICLLSLSPSTMLSQEPNKIIEIVYQWLPPHNPSEKVLYQECLKQFGTKWGDYYYAQLKHYQSAIEPTNFLTLGGQTGFGQTEEAIGKRLNYQIYINGAEVFAVSYQPVNYPGYKEIYYQVTPHGLLKTGELAITKIGSYVIHDPALIKPDLVYMELAQTRFGQSPKFSELITQSLVSARNWGGNILLGSAIAGLASMVSGLKGKERDVPPIASFTVEPSSGTILTTTFMVDASASYGPVLSILKYRWDWEDDGIWDTDFLSEPTATHQYDSTGIKTIRLAVLDAATRLSTTATQQVEIKPFATFSISPPAGVVGTIFTANASSSVPLTELQFRWDYHNDGIWEIDWSNTITTSFSYLVAGPKTILLEVRDKFGLIAQATKNIMVGATIADTPWPKFQHDLRNTGKHNYNGPISLYDELDTDRYFQTTGNIVTGIAVDLGSTAYVGTTAGKLYAIRTRPVGDPPSQKWVYPPGTTYIGAIRTTPIIATDANIYFGSDNGRFYAVDSNGTHKWSCLIGSPIRSSPTIDMNGTIYFGADNGRLYAIDQSGQILWDYPTAGIINTSPAIGPDGTIYVTSSNYLYAISPDGIAVWNQPFTTLDSIISSPAVGVDGTIYFGCHDQKLYAVKPDGSERWTYGPAPNYFDATPAIGSDGTIYIGCDDQKLYAIQSNGALKWVTTALGDTINSVPAVANNNMVYLTIYNGSIIAVEDRGVGNYLIKWSKSLGITGLTNPVALDSDLKLYVGAGSRFWRLRETNVDPAEIHITKRANKKNVSIGDIITYNITIQNSGADPAVTATIIDRIPAGFKYIEGSAYLDNVLLNAHAITRTLPTSHKKGRTTITFDLNGVPTNTLKTLSYQLVVGSGVTFGKYENQAYCQYFDVQWKTSNTAKETVEVMPDPLFDLGTIIGKVFNDKNGNGIQDAGEEGLGGIRIATEEGTIVTTDKDGKYHIPGVRPGVHLLKVDASSVMRPPDVTSGRPTTHDAIPDNPCVVRVTPGLLHKVNFGVTQKSEVRSQKTVVSSQNPESNNQAPTTNYEQRTTNNDFFLVALGDGELGYNKAQGNLEPVKHDDKFDDGFYSRGRVAYYLKGKIKGAYLITSSFDSERRTHNSELFRYIDPDKYYPVYGDASTVSFDATNTQGSLYLMIEHEPSKSSFLWGNYHTGLTGLELTNYNRTLYGAKLHYEGAGLMYEGKPDSPDLKARPSKITVFGASALQPSAHNEFRATGGTLFYLKHKDIVEGSAKITLEIRDKITQLVLSRQSQIEDRDYEIDYSNGRILFYKPVHSVSDSGSIISTHLLDGNPVYVVVDYEYRVPEYHFREGSYGGRASQEISDSLQIGATYVHEQKDNKDYQLTGIDSLLKVGDIGKLNVEYAESETGAVNNFVSTDGGLSFNTIAHPANDKGKAYLIKGTSNPLNLPNLGALNVAGYYKRIEPEFSSYLDINQPGTEKYGVSLTLKPSNVLTLVFRDDIQELEDRHKSNLAAQSSLGARKTETTMLQANYLKDRLSLTGEYRHQESDKILSAPSGQNFISETNYDTDVWAVRAGYEVSKKVNVYLEQQLTSSGERNHQTTAGATFKLFNSSSLKLQGTTGTKGESSLIGLDTALGNKSTVYTSFSQMMARSHGQNTPESTVIAGARTQITPQTVVYTQEEYRNQDKADSTGTILGLNTRLVEKIGLGLDLERSTVHELSGEVTRRTASGIGLQLVDKDRLGVHTRYEIRLDNNTVDKKQERISNKVDYKLNRDFTLLGKYQQSWTENKETRRTEARLKEHSLGIAYRPVKHDYFNCLAKYTYLEDLYPAGQTDLTNITHEKAQVYAFEGSYQLNEKWEVVEKYADKVGREKVGGRDFVKSETYLWINRLNYRIVGRWEVGAEYRMLVQKLAEDRKDGYLLEVMYNLQKHISLGLGYNFTDFSDDLTSQNDYSVKGPFIRLIGKF